jgi:predicted metal-dependent TIM-barrel fold hydrolase
MMKTQNILLKTAHCPAGMMILTSIGLNILQYQRIKKLSENTAPKSVTKEESTDSPMTAPVKMVQENKNMEPAVKDTNMSAINELEYHLNAAEEELDMVSEQLSVAREMEMAAQVYGKYAEVSDNIMPPAQTEQYKAYLRKQRQMYESQLTMSSFLLGGKTDKKSDEEISD